MYLTEITMLTQPSLNWTYWNWYSKWTRGWSYMSFVFWGQSYHWFDKVYFNCCSISPFINYVDELTLRKTKTWWWSVSLFWWCLCCLWRGWCGSSGECHSWARFPLPLPSLVVTSRYTPEGHPPVTENQDKITLNFFWNKSYNKIFEIFMKYLNSLPR